LKTGNADYVDSWTVKGEKENDARSQINGFAKLRRRIPHHPEGEKGANHRKEKRRKVVKATGRRGRDRRISKDQTQPSREVKQREERIKKKRSEPEGRTYRRESRLRETAQVRKPWDCGRRGSTREQLKKKDLDQKFN